jgi:redox-sensitive bicupin YhaK (pirin superfamily)
MQKKIIRLEHPRHSHMVGDGFRVSQYIPWYGREMTPETSPFLMLDYNAPWQIPPQNDGYRPGVGFHPHRGFETVTIVYSWEIEHQDTAWNGGVIGADEVQWMTAGSGLLHNEFMTEKFARSWWTQHAVQLWVDLPKDHKLTPPRYQALTRENIPLVPFDGGLVRVIAWEFQGRTWAAKTFSPVELWDVRFESGWLLKLDFPTGYNVMLLITQWSATANSEELKNGDMLYFSREWEEIILETNLNAKILIMAGKPLWQSVINYWPFVMTTEQEIIEAWQDYQNGKMWRVDMEE